MKTLTMQWNIIIYNEKLIKILKQIIKKMNETQNDENINERGLVYQPQLTK